VPFMKRTTSLPLTMSEMREFTSDISALPLELLKLSGN
jgi:hypothetical protein